MKKILAFLTILSSFVLAGSMVKFESEIKYSGKPTILIFDSKGCPYCERMKKDLEEIEFLHDIAKEFEIYRIPRDDFQAYTIFGTKTSTQELQIDYRIKVTPYVVIFNKKGEKVWQIPGYSDPFLFTKILKFVKGLDEGRYKKSQWRKYLYEKGVIKSPDKRPNRHQ